MWGVPHPHHLKGGLMLDKQASEAHSSQSQGVLIWLWVRIKETFEGGGGSISIHHREQLWTIYSLGGVLVNLDSVCGIVNFIPLGREGHHSGHPPCRSVGD